MSLETGTPDFTAWAVREWPTLYRAARRYFTAHDAVYDAEDAVAETFCKAWQHWANGGTDANGRLRWLYTILFNTLRDYTRRRARRSWCVAVGDARQVEHAVSHAARARVSAR